jgi:16S rRNA (cytosine967-C5)-methyltransferase
VQDPASVAVGVALQVQPGDRVLDLAAAPGGKTLQLADAGAGLLVAVERHPRRLRSARRRLAGVDVHWVRADATAPPFAAGSFDRILLDAPCSGLGTLRRRPEIRLRADQADVARLAGLQRGMLEAARPLLAPGGILVYSVCTVTPSETTGVVAGLPAAAPVGLPGRRLDGGLLMAPHLTGTDGMFISVIRS